MKLRKNALLYSLLGLYLISNIEISQPYQDYLSLLQHGLNAGLVLAGLGISLKFGLDRLALVLLTLLIPYAYFSAGNLVAVMETLAIGSWWGAYQLGRTVLCEKDLHYIGVNGLITCCVLVVTPYNSNVLAFYVWAFSLIQPNLSLKILGLVLMVLTGSLGGILALGAGLGWLFLGWVSIPIITLSTILATMGRWNSLNSVGVRLEMYQSAWAGFTLTPFMGNGLGSFNLLASNGQMFSRVHNLPLDLAYKMGFLGLFSLLGLLVWIFIRRRIFSPYVPFLLAFGVHALVDNPQYYPVSILLFALLGIIERTSKDDLSIRLTWGLAWFNISRYRPSPASTDQP